MVDGITVEAIEPAGILHDRHGNSIEHFGYADGKSQPRFFTGDLERPSGEASTGGWDDGFSPAQVLSPCPSGQGYGSFLVYRKLEQDVRNFRAAVHALARELEISAEEAGGLIVGRTTDGTPIHLASGPVHDSADNSFTFPGEIPAAPSVPTSER